MRTVQYEYTENISVEAELQGIDDSFDYGFGKHEAQTYEVKKIEVFLHIGQQKIDITSQLELKLLEELEDKAIIEATEEDFNEPD